MHKAITTDALKVPKSFKYSERYMSPIDRLMSPISRGLMARNRKEGPLLPPSKSPSKLLDD
uniref:Uncharacterized protein n=1 Tax=Nelumbo nucifera TaxID=4432 RepID=A0A822XZB7_NELNU|nr:TPA_asm: hypothetical protein HUJ06_026025 [Nelumbo nucifera]